MQSTVNRPPRTRSAQGPPPLYQELLYSQAGKRGILVGPTHSAAMAAQNWVQDRTRESLDGSDQAVVISGRAAKVAWLLMDNALKHTRSGTPVGSLKVELTNSKFLLTVAVTDGGPPLFTERQSFPEERADGSGGLNEVRRLSVDWWWEGNAGTPLTVSAHIELP
ncbi:ATP-binding protein [Nocardiopsis metallicus]|uniref:ATP-binding protein n=1 Tax=Nocardiopsis metallicus TaxID=179819 RepID=A0A840WCR0_9ACTN|nr:ATP-binding protein [Nocardiopsis metallicus]MBB5494789.1 hypothetical protein [Nocardiopsis metallicus]